MGFKANPFLEQYGWKPGAGSDWDKEATAKALRFWADQGYEAAEMVPDHYTGGGNFLSLTDDELTTIRKVFEDSGITIHGFLGWRRMFWREPWIDLKSGDMYEFARMAELLGCTNVDVQPAYSLPIVPAAQSQPVISPGRGPTRQMFRSLWDATPGDFEAAAKWLKEYAQRVADFGATLSLQMHPDCLADIPVSTIRLIDMAEEPNIGLNPDTFDCEWQYPEYQDFIVPTAAEACKIVAPYVNYWHAKNWRRVPGPDGHWKFFRTHLDEGDQPIGLMVQNLVDVGFDGAVILECGRGFEYATTPATLLRSRDYIKWMAEVYAPAVPTRTTYGKRPTYLKTGTPGT